MVTITKKELINRIAAVTGQTKMVTREIVQRFLDEIVRQLADGNRLEFREFGVFEVRERAARKARNPQTRQNVHVPPTLAVRFRVGRSMREAVERLARAHDGRNHGGPGGAVPPST